MLFERIIRPAITVCVLAVLLGGCSKHDDSDQPADTLIDTGLEYLRVFNFEAAYLPLSEACLKLNEDDPQWALATYSLALCAWHKSPPAHANIEEATRLLHEVIQRAPDSPFTPSALLDLGRIAEVSDHLGDPTDVVEAQRYYARVRENYPNTDMAARATLLYAQSLAQSFEAEAIKQGVSMLEAEMKAQPDSAWYATIAQYTAQLYAFYLDDAKDALKPYDAAARAGFPRAADSDLYLWQYGLLAQEAGEDLIAADAFRRIVADYPRSIYGTVARQRMRDIAQKHPEALIKIPEHGDAGLGR